MSTNPWAQYAVGGPKTPPTSVPTETQPSNSWSQYAVGTAPSESSSTSTDTTPAPKNAWSQYAIGGDKTPEAETSNLPNPAPPQAQNQSLLDKAWHFVNTPLAEDFGAPSDIKGVPGFLGGVERGAYKVALGLTSPLSLALTIGTLGTSGFLESAGGTALKEALMAGDEGLDAAGATAKVEQFAKAAKAAKEAMTTGAQPVSQAVQATGMDYNEFRSLNSMLHEAGLNSDNLMTGAENLKDSLMGQGLDEETAAREAAQIQQKEAQAKGVLNGYFEQQGLDPAAAQTKIAQFQKAADAAKTAATAQNEPIAAAVKAASGMDYDEFTSLGNILRDNGLTQDDVIGDNITRRLTSKLFSKMGATPAQAQRIAKGSEFLMNAGFAAQQVHSAWNTIPQFEQAMKEGDYKAAGEYLTEGVVNGTLGLIGTSHAYHSAGEAWKPLAPDEIDKQRPSDENYKLNQFFGEMEKRHQVAENMSKNFETELHQAMGAKTGFWSGMLKNKADQEAYRAKLDKMLMATATGNDPELARQYGNALADAIGKPEMKVEAQKPFYQFTPLDTSKPVSGTFYHGTKAPIESVTQLDPGSHGDEQALYGIGAYLTDNPNIAEGYAKTKGAGPTGKVLTAKIDNANLLNLENPLPQNAKDVFEQTYKSLGGDEALPDDITGKEAFKKIQEIMHEERYPRSEAQDVLGELTINLRQQGYDGLAHTGGEAKGTPHNVAILFPDYGVGRPLSDIITDTPKPPPPIHPAMPENIQEMVQHAKDNLSAEAKSHLERWMNAYHAVANGLDDAETDVYNKLRKMDDRTWNIGNAMGLIRSRIENHIHQIWEKPPTDIGNEVVQEGRTGSFETAVNTARRRVFQTYLEGLLRGYKIKGDDPVAVIGHDFTRIYKAAAHKAFLDRLRDHNIRASDGRPLIVMSGMGHMVTGPNGDNAAYLINPNRVRNIKIADDAVDRLRASGDLDRFLAKKDIIDITPKIRMDNIGSFIDQYEKMAEKQEPQFDEEGNTILRQKIAMLKDVQDHKVPVDMLDEINAQQKPIYAWHPQDYVYPHHTAFKAWNWLTHTDDGTNILVHSDMKLHPESAQYVMNRLGIDYSPLRDESTLVGKVGSKILKGGAEAKSVLLSFSPFHAMQIALRGVMMGVNPFKMDLTTDMKSDPFLRRGVRNGLTIASDRHALEQHSEGLTSHSKLISKIPILGHAMDWYQDTLFNRYIPAMKADAYATMFDKYRKAHPDWSDDGVAKAAAEHTNNAFGGINWKALGRSTATQDWFRIFALAPDWLESEMRFTASMFRGGLGEKNFSREQVLKMAAGLWGTARVLNYLNTGNFHFEAPFGVATKDKNGREIIYSVRTMPTDILHMADDPVGFIKGRMSPFFRLSQEAMTGRDIYGRKLAPGDLAIDIARNMVPIPFEDVGQMMTGSTPEVGNVGQMAKAGGVTAEVYRSPAEKLAIDLASQRDESGVLNHAQVRHLEGLSRIENGLRSGTITYQQLEDARDFGPLTPDDYKKIRDNLKLTHGLDPDMAAMVTKVNRMPAQDALQVWNVATPREKTALMHVMIKKKQSYIKKAFESETPQERMNDQTFLTFRQMFREPVNENQE